MVDRLRHALHCGLQDPVMILPPFPRRGKLPQVRPDADILVPVFARYTRADLVSPFAGPRNITALLRFQVVPGDGKYLIANHGSPAPARPGPAACGCASPQHQ